jgi:hypothetical protein
MQKVVTPIATLQVAAGLDRFACSHHRSTGLPEKKQLYRKVSGSVSVRVAYAQSIHTHTHIYIYTLYIYYAPGCISYIECTQAASSDRLAQPNQPPSRFS